MNIFVFSKPAKCSWKLNLNMFFVADSSWTRSYGSFNQ